MTALADTHHAEHLAEPIGQLPRVWLMISFASLAVGFALTFEPSFDDAQAAFVTLLPFALLPTMAVAFTRTPSRGPSTALRVAAVASVASWSVLVFHDDRWSILTFALFGLCFSMGRLSGIALAGVVTVVWTLAWIDADAPGWRLAIPPAVLAVGIVLWATLARASAENTMLAELVDELHATRGELAASEREKGVLEERARFAAEIHDTLAQGFTSIVVLSRAARRSGDWLDGVAEIEHVAAENLQAARRLVAASGPAELESVALPDALRREVAAAIGNASSHFDVTGTPVTLGGAVEVALLRGLQEALLNTTRHAQASEVHVTLSYLDDVVLLDVRDDGVGFEPGTTSHRGDLTGGQGLRALRQRAESLGGQLTVESRVGDGTAISIHLPTASS